MSNSMKKWIWLAAIVSAYVAGMCAADGFDLVAGIFWTVSALAWVTIAFERSKGAKSSPDL